MKKWIHATILVLIALATIGWDCYCPFTPIGEYEIWTVHPPDGATVFTEDVTLMWSDRGQTAMFHVYLGTSPDDFVELCGQSGLADYCHDTVFTVTSLEPATTYYWYILGVYDARGHYQTETSEMVSFTTVDEFCDQGEVRTPTPDSGATGVSLNPHFAWEVCNIDLLPYDFDIYLGMTTDPPLLASGLSAPWYDLTSDTLDDTTLYYWRVETYYGADTVAGPLWEFTTTFTSDANVFALFEVDARQAPSGYHVMEELRARFDVDPIIMAPTLPLQADSVFCEGIRLDWSAVTSSYSYTEWSMPFVENGEPAEFIVFGNGSVPTLTTDIVFPACTLGITEPESFDMVSINGFEVLWDGSECGGTVWLTLMDGNDSTGVWKEVTNDGSDSLTAVDLAPLGGQTGTYNLIVLRLVEENIDAPGYSPESLIRARAINVMEQINISGS